MKTIKSPIMLESRNLNTEFVKKSRVAIYNANAYSKNYKIFSYEDKGDIHIVDNYGYFEVTTIIEGGESSINYWWVKIK